MGIFMGIGIRFRMDIIKGKSTSVGMNTSMTMNRSITTNRSITMSRSMGMRMNSEQGPWAGT
jgi:hypothetical protein